jgi:hypothetical protein
VEALGHPRLGQAEIFGVAGECDRRVERPFVGQGEAEAHRPATWMASMASAGGLKIIYDQLGVSWATNRR